MRFLAGVLHSSHAQCKHGRLLQSVAAFISRHASAPDSVVSSPACSRQLDDGNRALFVIKAVARADHGNLVDVRVEVCRAVASNHRASKHRLCIPSIIFCRRV